MSLTRIAVIFFAVFSLGCAPTLTDARYAINRISESFATTEPALEKQRRAHGDECFLSYPPGSTEKRQACLDDVNRRWRPVEVAVAVVYAAIVAAQGAVGEAEATAAIGGTPSIAQVLSAVTRAIDAATRLSAAVDRLPTPASAAIMRP